MQDEVQIRNLLTQAKKKHSELDETIIPLIQLGTHDQLHLRRLKKRKLQLKDQITALNSNLIPDDIA
ncbi:MAG: YdcH family protein [Alphaproteobacteria bacterium]